MALLGRVHSFRFPHDDVSQVCSCGKMTKMRFVPIDVPTYLETNVT